MSEAAIPVTVLTGYLGSGKPPRDWGADAIAATPGEILGIRAAKR